MKSSSSNSACGWSARATITILALFFSFAIDAPLQAHAKNVASGATSSVDIPAPQGVKVLAQFPLQGPPASRMYIQWEHGSTYLYIEQGSAQLTALDITRKNHPRAVDHKPEPVTGLIYMNADGGPIEDSSLTEVRAGVDNVRDRGTLSALQANDPQDAQLLQFFGNDSSNLVDRDRHLIFFASPTRLLIVEDERWYGVDYSIN